MVKERKLLYKRCKCVLLKELVQNKNETKYTKGST
jgi:hypothetical protein